MSTPAVRAEDLWFTYKPMGVKAGKLPPSLAGVSFEAREGEVYGILGPNGAGKTTLIKAIATLILPDKGRLEVLGHAIPGGERDLRHRIGVAFAEYERTFHLRLTGRQNLRFFASFLDMPRPHVARRIEETLAHVGLVDAGDKMVFEYSTGMKHRLAVARALLSEPELLILDEPTAGLDAQTSRALGDLVLKLAREDGATILYTTHRLEEAGRLCDRIGILRRGALVAQESPAGLAKLAGALSVVLVKLDRVDEPLAEAARALPGVERAALQGTQVLRVHARDVEVALAPLLDLVQRSGRHVLGVRTEEPTVEDAFLALTKEAEAPHVPS